MRKFDYPELDECVYREVLPNGLHVTVIPRKGFTKSLAYFRTTAPSTGIFPWTGRTTMHLQAWPIFWSIKCLTCLAGMCRRSLPPWAPAPTPSPATT